MIKENCSCGAVFEVNGGDDIFQKCRYAEFLDAHRKCREVKTCKLSKENERLTEEADHFKNECIAERRGLQKVREEEREWFNRYEKIMCVLMGKLYEHQDACESGYPTFESCINDFIDSYCKLKKIDNPLSPR